MKTKLILSTLFALSLGFTGCESEVDNNDGDGMYESQMNTRAGEREDYDYEQGMGYSEASELGTEYERERDYEKEREYD